MRRGSRPGTDDLEQLYARDYGRFLRVATGLLQDVEQGRDAVHETFVRAVAGVDRFRGESSLETWVWRILSNVCASERRRIVLRVADPSSEPSCPEHDDLSEVRAAVAALPERQRLVLFLRHYADLDYEQIAATLGVERGTVAATLHAAHARLRNTLTEVSR